MGTKFDWIASPNETVDPEYDLGTSPNIYFINPTIIFKGDRKSIINTKEEL